MERAAAEAAHMSAPDHVPHRSRRFLLLLKGRPHMSAPDHGPHRSRRFLLLPKGRPHMSQTWRRAQDGLCPTPVSHFVNLWKTEVDREQPVLLADRPRAGKAEALAQPQHRLEALNGPSRCMEGLKAADPRHRSLDPKVVALDPLLQVFADVVDGIVRQEPVFPGRRDGGWIR